MIPQPDPIGLLAAVVSAALFSFAIVFLARSRGKAEFQSIVTPELPPRRERELFEDVLMERRSPGLGLAASAVLHAWVLLAAPAMPYLFPEKLRIDFRNYDVKIVEFRLPRPVMYAAQPQSQPARQRAPRIEQPGREAAAAAASRLQQRTRFELPVAPGGRPRDVILQPDRPPDLPLLMRPNLPTAFLWAQRPAPLERPQLAGLTQPRPDPPKPFVFPQAVPQLQRPNQEMAISDLQIAAAPVATFHPPRLAVMPANVTPVGLAAPEMAPRGELPATVLPPGTPMNLIALMRTPATAASAYMLEAGNRPAGAESGAPGGPDGSTAGGASPSTPGSVPSAATPGVLKGSHADLLAAAPRPPESPTESDKRPQETRPPAGAPGGNLGVIIVQQSSQESILEGAEVLSGEPVYTVFLDVPNTPRRWVLQYCVAGSRPEPSSQISEGVIRIVPRKSVQPPYPLERVPLEMNGFAGSARRLVLYAVVNERGEPENVRLIRGAGEEIDKVAVATLQRWSFRPATRGDAPVAVEALFGIPLQ